MTDTETTELSGDPAATAAGAQEEGFVAQRYAVDAILPVTTADGEIQPREQAAVSEPSDVRSAATPLAAGGARPTPIPGADLAAAAAARGAAPPKPALARDTKLQPEKTTSAPHSKRAKARAAKRSGVARSAKTGKGATRKVSKAKPRHGKKATASARRQAKIRRATVRIKRARQAKRAAQRRRAFLATKIIDVPVVRVQGILVHRRLGGKTAALMRAADRAGLRLGGWGYRSTLRQIQLRRAHCGKSRYAMFRMPAGRCWPPTAPPGKSMHERGLAIDFFVEGRKGRAKPIAGTREFRWLRRHAHKFGFHNLPSEAWHWSTNGR